MDQLTILSIEQYLLKKKLNIKNLINNFSAQTTWRVIYEASFFFTLFHTSGLALLGVVAKPHKQYFFFLFFFLCSYCIIFFSFFFFSLFLLYYFHSRKSPMDWESSRKILDAVPIQSEKSDPTKRFPQCHLWM